MNFIREWAIWGKTNILVTWQDTSNQDNNFFVGHKYTIEGDSVIFKIILWPDPRFIGHTFKYKFEIKENEYIVNGIIPAKKWGLQ